MALFPVGQYVTYTAASDSPRSQPPSGEEQTYGIVRQAFTDKGDPFYQVVWDPASMTPKTGLYHESQLNPIDKNEASNIQSQIAAGTYQPAQQTPGSQYQDTIPQQALPPQLQAGTFSPTDNTSNPSIQSTGQ